MLAEIKQGAKSCLYLSLYINLQEQNPKTTIGEFTYYLKENQTKGF